MEGKRRFAPWDKRASSGRGPVLTAMVKTPAATAACTPRGAFSMTMKFSQLSGESWETGEAAGREEAGDARDSRDSWED